MFALLPLKHNSVRVPNKNIRMLSGKPLFYHIADKLKETHLFENLVINTDSSEIKSLALNRYSDWVKIIDRPNDLIGDDVSMNLIIKNDIRILGENHNYFQTHSTNPLLTVDTIIDAVNLFLESKNLNSSVSIFSCNKIQSRFYNSKLEPINHNPSVLIKTQDLEVLYQENSNFYIFSGKSFMENNHRISNFPIPYITKSYIMESVDIDNEEDWILVEKLIRL